MPVSFVGRRTAISASVRSGNTTYAGTFSSREIVRRKSRKRAKSASSAPERIGASSAGATSRGRSAPRRFAPRAGSPPRNDGAVPSSTTTLVPMQLSQPAHLERAAGSPKYRSTSPRRHAFVYAYCCMESSFCRSAFRRRSITAQSMRNAVSGFFGEVRVAPEPVAATRGTDATGARRAAESRRLRGQNPAEAHRRRSPRHR